MRGVVVGALALLLAAGCGGGSGDKNAAPEPPSTTAAPVAACPAGQAAAAGATDTATAPGDFDGDGRPDRLSTYRVASAGTWHVREELAGGGASEVELPAAAQGVKAVGGAKLDVGTGDAAFVVVGTGAAGTNLGLFVLQSCKLARVNLAGGVPAEFLVRASATARAGVACQVPGLVVYSATTTDGQAYAASSVSYLLVGTLLDEAHRSTTPLAASDPALSGFGSFSCGTLKL
jgi:hypothetical protein